MYLTQWGANLTFIYVIAIQFANTQSSKKFLRFLQILFALCFTLQFIITLVYWLALHKDLMISLQKRNTPQLITQVIIHLHTIPMFVLLIDFFNTNYKFELGDIVYLNGFSFCYLLVNLVLTKYYDEVIYPFLTWKDYTSVIVSAVIFVVFNLFYLAIWKMLSGKKAKTQ